MDQYRIYGLDHRGRIQFGDYVDCPDDAVATTEARRLLARFASAEVWFGRRKVADVPGPDPRRA